MNEKDIQSWLKDAAKKLDPRGFSPLRVNAYEDGMMVSTWLGDKFVSGHGETVEEAYRIFCKKVPTNESLAAQKRQEAERLLAEARELEGAK